MFNELDHDKEKCAEQLKNNSTIIVMIPFEATANAALRHKAQKVSTKEQDKMLLMSIIYCYLIK